MLEFERIMEKSRHSPPPSRWLSFFWHSAGRNYSPIELFNCQIISGELSVISCLTCSRRFLLGLSTDGFVGVFEIPNFATKI